MYSSSLSCQLKCCLSIFILAYMTKLLYGPNLIWVNSVCVAWCLWFTGSSNWILTLVEEQKSTNEETWELEPEGDFLHVSWLELISVSLSLCSFTLFILPIFFDFICGAGDGTQGLICARQVLYHSANPQPSLFILRYWIVLFLNFLCKLFWGEMI